MSDAHTDSTLDIPLSVASTALDVRKERLEDEVTELFERWRPALLRYISTFGLPPHDAEEIVQEVFLALFSHLRKNKARVNLRSWLFRVAHNLALKYRHAEPPSEAAAEVENLPHPALNPEEELARNRREKQLRSVLLALPGNDRRCLYLRAEGLRYREIAKVTGMSLGAVALSLERSLSRFQQVNQR